MAKAQPTRTAGALSRTPSTTTDDKKQWKKPPTHRYNGVWVDDKGYRVDNWGRRLAGQTKPFEPIKESNKPTAPKQPGKPGRKLTPEEKFIKKPVKEQDKDIYESSGAYLDRILRMAMKYDPSKFDYQKNLDQARQVAMKQFEQTMGPEFARQDAAFTQQMLEQGIDPNSGAYQAQYRALKQSQNEARQNAMTSAFTAGAGYEAQGWQQQMQNQMLPSQIFGNIEKPYELMYASGQEAEQNRLNREAAAKAAASRGGGGGGGGMSAAQIAALNAQANAGMAGYGSPQQPNPWAAFAQGFGTGAGAAGMNYWLR